MKFIIILLFLVLLNFKVVFSQESSTKSPTTAMALSVVPGLGQVYNEDYWKAPILFGSAGTMLGLAIYYNNEFTDIEKLIKQNADNQSYVYQLKQRREFYRDSRDQFYLYLTAVYVVSILDAYTGAYLYHFDINEDTSMNFGIINNKVGLNFSYKLK